MRVVRKHRSVSSPHVRLRSFLRKIAEESNIARRKKDNERLQSVRMSLRHWLTILLLIILMLFAMAVGGYLAQIFKGRMIEVGDTTIARSLQS